MNRHVQKFLIVSLAALTLAAAEVSAQTATTGGVTGRITDASGASMPNVTIELENMATGQRFTIVTQADGVYRFENLPVARYRVITRAANAAAPAQEIQVELGREVVVNLAMTGGSTSTDALVSAETSPTSLNPASIMKNWNTRYIQYLPRPNFMSKDGSLAGAYNLSFLTEAVNSGGFGQARGPAVAGNRPISNNFNIDGFDNNNKANPGPLAYVSNEATQEFALFLNQPSPLFGHSAGGKFNSLVSSGTNRWHGQFYDYLQNRELNAMEPAQKRAGLTDNPRYDQNRLGASLGGPIVPSKFFVFGNFEYIPLGFQRVNPTDSLVPTTAGFASLRNVLGSNSSNLGILQNAVGDVNQAVGTQRIAGVEVPVGNFNALSRGWQNQFNGIGSADWTINEKSQLQFRYVHNELENTNPFYSLSGFATPFRLKNHLANVSHHHTFGNAVTNELRFGWNRTTSGYRPGTPQFTGLAQVPNLQIEGFTNLAFGQPFGIADTARLNTWQLSENIAFRLGRNDLRIGYDGRRYQGVIGNLASRNGNYAYSSIDRFLLDQTPDVLNQRSFGSGLFDAGQWLHFAYIQDHFQLMPNVAIDLGLRYTNVSLPTQLERQRSLAGLSVSNVLTFDKPKTDSHLFAPYVGVAWSPTFGRNTVIRGSFGMDYDALYSGVFNAFAGQFGGVATGGFMTNNTGGFLRNGGFDNVTLPGMDPTLAQQRAVVGAFYGRQHVPYAMHWNVSLQQSLWRGMTVELRYLGNRGLNLPIFSLLGGTPVTATNSLPLFNTQPSNAQLNSLPLTLNQLQAPGALATAGFTSPISTIDFAGKSWYHGGTIDISQRFAGGFQMFGNYTYSHLRDNATGTPLDINFPDRRYDTSLYDRRHRANVTALFELAPLFKNTYSVLRNVFANFNVSGTYTYQSDTFVPVFSGANTLLTGTQGASAFFNPSGTPGAGSGVTPLTNASGQTVAYLANNPNAQFISGGPGSFGVPRRNAFSLGDIHNLDVAAVKRFSYHEAFSFEVRGEAYNILNRTNFTLSPINAIGGMTATPFFTPASLGFGDPRGAFNGNARVLQVALRVAF